jgi:hypothetical protein
MLRLAVYVPPSLAGLQDLLRQAAGAGFEVVRVFDAKSLVQIPGFAVEPQKADLAVIVRDPDDALLHYDVQQHLTGLASPVLTGYVPEIRTLLQTFARVHAAAIAAAWAKGSNTETCRANIALDRMEGGDPDGPDVPLMKVA